MLQATLLWYKKFRGDLESIGFEFNHYDPCIANKMIKNAQHTVRFHVDDLMSSHRNPKVNDKFHGWLSEEYGGYGKVKATRGNVHEYLGMTFDFSQKGNVMICMRPFLSTASSPRIASNTPSIKTGSDAKASAVVQGDTR